MRKAVLFALTASVAVIVSAPAFASVAGHYADGAPGVRAATPPLRQRTAYRYARYVQNRPPLAPISADDHEEFQPTVRIEDPQVDFTKSAAHYDYGPTGLKDDVSTFGVGIRF